MSRGRKVLIAVSTFALAATVALGGGSAASAVEVKPPVSGTANSTYSNGQAEARSSARAAAIPVEFRANYRVAGGKNTINVNALDKPGGVDVSVAVKNLNMQRLISGQWRTVATNPDNDGWHATSDPASLTVYCVKGSLYRAQYTIKFSGKTTPEQTGTVTTSNWSC